MMLFPSIARKLALLFVLPLAMISVASMAANVDGSKAEYKRPLDIPFPKNAPYSPQMATLGKMLFFDPRLSGANNMSCSSCHNPSFGYETPVDRAVGAMNSKVGRHAPTILNSAWTKPFFWDGRAKNLEEQAAGPITADVEMNQHFSELVKELSAIEEYKTWFDRLFPGSGVTRANILTSIATYERTVVTGWSPFDRWIDGDETAMSESAKRGFALYNGKAGCNACHTGWNFTDNQFHDIGLATEDIGRAKYEAENPKAKHAFKTPGLRNLTYRAPFMHNGSVSDLLDVIIHYESGGIERPSRSDKIKPFTLSGEERTDLLNFLKSLTAAKINTPIPNLPN